MSAYDAVVVGLGGMGSAALAALAARGGRILGLEARERGHDRGSSAGRSRIIRLAYFEHPAYVPLLRRAYDGWFRLEAASGTKLLDLCGMLVVGGAESPVLAGARSSAAAHGLDLETLDGAAIVRRYPTLRLEPGERGVFEAAAGMVFPEAAVEAYVRVAQTARAELRFNAPVRAYLPRPDGIRLELADGSTVWTRRLALCAGPWLGTLARELGLPLRVQRNVQLWFSPASDAYARERFPVFLLDRAGLAAPLYGFPDAGAGLKAALHGFGATTTADALDRNVHAADVAPVRAALDAFMPGAAGAFAFGKACMYTLTPDQHFIVDVHPNDPRIVFAGGFSGHGFKFCPVIGEIVADLTLDATTRHPIDFLSLRRFTNRA